MNRDMVGTAQWVCFSAVALVVAGCGVDERSVSTRALEPAGASGAGTSPDVSEVAPGAGASSAGAGGGATGLAGEGESDPGETLLEGAADPVCEGAGCSSPPAGEVTLSFSFEGAPSGQVTLVAGSTSLVCRESCSLVVPRGAAVLLTALPAFGGAVVRWSDTSCGNEISCAVRAEGDTSVRVAIELGFNIVFTSAASYAVTDLPSPGVEADQHCAALAAAAGLPGQRWVAWLAGEGPTTAPEDDIDPIERFQHTGGWVRTDGVIVATSVAALGRGETLHKRDAGEARYPWTGTSSFGSLLREADGTARDCDNWTSLSAERYGTISDGPGLGLGLGFGAKNCAGTSPMLCFGDDSDKPLPIVTALPNRLAFLAAASFTPGGGIAAADAICQQEACAAGLTGSSDCSQSLGNTRTFKTYLSRVGQPAAQRFDLAGPNWVRPDGLMWHRAADLGNNGAGRLTALSVTLAREYLTLNQGVWLGDPAPIGNCQDWTSNLGEASVGVAWRDDGDAFGVGTVACSDPGRLYCLEE